MCFNKNTRLRFAFTRNYVAVCVYPLRDKSMFIADAVNSA